MKIFAEAAKLEQQNSPFALAQIVDSRGSTPRHSAQMLVRNDGSVLGTIGGGMMERCVINEALLALAERKPRLFHGRMARNGEDAVGSDCGGAMTVYIDVHGHNPRLVLIGAGHVNQAIAKAAAALDFNIHVADVYADNLNPDYFPLTTRLLQAKSFTEAIDALQIEAEDYVVIATNSQDKEALDCLIHRPTKYLGLLASHRKTQTFLHQLRTNSVPEAELERLHAPIGFNIGAETPQEIAISILAEIVQYRHQAPGGPMKTPETVGRLVVIRGAGDIATGVALRLYHSGFRVVMLEMAKPTVIRCSVAFAQAMFNGEVSVEGVKARHAASVDEVPALLRAGIIPILADEKASLLPMLRPDGVVDAILAKVNKGTHRGMAPVTIALGPGFEAGKDCDAVIETNRGHYLGRVIYQGHAQANTGIPGNINGETTRRVMRAAVAGKFRCNVKLGDMVNEGDIVAWLGDTPVLAPLSGMVRGLLNDGLSVTVGFKIGDVDPRGIAADFTTVSDKARAIGGAVLEAMMALPQKQTPVTSKVPIREDALVG
ncbi:EF2563 family selenium-dependent molybdenum hydroxylase system protein [Buttiauxella sp. B2]|uniref:selenium-dependent molybdenum cofactor biosynthesis protein YqeB n=1 Tax=Buttiauxella sp. B2 TaxID=2587812 RepID=UPI00111D1693|nr:selenium-dependent molybdenum cofactor biosynthesis protein YqeB [Buttiauxella sp. B2]TNV21951.1 EF2563 family selenium-dependent molybdenum hydroxylase system protein [Buttiauxella sp. B2]